MVLMMMGMVVRLGSGGFAALFLVNLTRPLPCILLLKVIILQVVLLPVRVTPLHSLMLN